MTNTAIATQAGGERVVSMQSTPAKVLVESEYGDHEYFIPVSLISHCEFFKNADSRRCMKHDQYLTVTVEDVSNPTVFKAYVYWLNHSQVLFIDSDASPADDTFLAQFYEFAVQEGNRKLQDHIVDAIMALTTSTHESEEPWLPSAEFVNHIYGSTSPESPARRLMVDIYVKEAGEELLMSAADRTQWAPEFLLELSVALLKRRKLSSEAAQAYKDPATGNMRPFLTKSCCYHCHGPDETCGAMEG